jgi:hypothetical protein
VDVALTIQHFEALILVLMKVSVICDVLLGRLVCRYHSYRGDPAFMFRGD